MTSHMVFSLEKPSGAAKWKVEYVQMEKPSGKAECKGRLGKTKIRMETYEWKHTNRNSQKKQSRAKWEKPK